MHEDAAAILAEARALLPDRFEPKRLLGRGGMAAVVLARHPALGRDVAIKLLPTSLHDDPIARERFIREARACARLTHNNIVTVHDVDENAGYIVMEHVEGVSLGARLAKRGAMSVDDVIKLGRAMLAALRVAHDAGIVHRDIKPSNILIDATDTPKLADFGIAHVGEASLTQTGNFVGTPAYMAPEQLRGRTVDGRADVYSLGATLFEAVTGQKLHAKTASIENVARAVRAATNNRGLAVVIQRAVAESPDDRFADVASFDAALADVEAGWEPTSTRWPGAAPTRPNTIRSFAVAALVGLVGSVAAVVTARQLEPRAHAPVRVALLPFEVTQGRADLAFVTGGLPEVLHGELSASNLVEPVRYQTIARELPNANPSKADWLDAARVLGAGLALGGEVRGADGDDLFVELRLIALHGTVLERWSDRVVGHEGLTAFVRRTAAQITTSSDEHGRDGDVVYQRHLGRGVESLGDHDLSPAMEHLAAAVEKDPTRADAHFFLAIAQWWAESPPEELRSTITRARAAGVTKDRALFLDGLELLIAERYTEAISFFERFRAGRPTSRAASYGLYEALFHGGRTRDAVRVYRELTDRFPQFQLGALHTLTYAAVHADHELLAWALVHVEGNTHYLDWPGRRWVVSRDYERAIETLTRASESSSEHSARATQALLETLFVSGHDDVVAARLASIREAGEPWHIPEHALAVLRGDASAIRKQRERVLISAEQRIRSGQRVGFTDLANVVFTELLSASPIELDALLGTLARHAEQRDDREPRQHIVRAHGAIVREDRAALTRFAKSPHLELRHVANGGLAFLDQRFEEARDHYEQAIAAAGDGRFIGATYYQQARTAQALNDDAGVVRACDEVIRPRLFRWGWAGWVGPCLVLTAEASEGDAAARAAAIARLERLRRDAPANDPLMTKIR